RRNRAPALLTAAAVVATCSRLSTAHGPAMTPNLPPPNWPAPTLTAVSLGFTSRETSFHGREIGTASATPVMESNRRGSSGPWLPLTPIARRVEPGISLG